MNIQEIPVEKIKQYENNPRNNEKAIPAVANSIKRFGFQQPIVIDKNYVIVAGHTRYCAARYLGKKTVPCVMVDDLTEAQVTAYRLADNKLGELARWDSSMLDAEIKELDDDSLSDFFIEEQEEEEMQDVKQVCTCPKCRYTAVVEMFRTRK